MPTNFIVVAYATRHGQSRRVAEQVAKSLTACGCVADLLNVADQGAVEWGDYTGAVLVASVHAGHHEKEMIAFVKGARPALDRMPHAFLSVTLTEADAEDAAAPEDRRAKAAAEVRMMVETFVAETGWRPRRVVPVAGALLFSQYNPFLRFVMKRIARRQRGPAVDTSHDTVFTDWIALDRFARSFAAELHPVHSAA